MEHQSPSKILQLNAVCTTLPFVLSTRQRAPRGALGDYPLLSMYDECHTYECIITFDFLSGTGFDQSARGLAALSYIKSSTCSQTSSVPALEPSLVESRSSKNRLSDWQEPKAGMDAHTKNG